MLKKNVVIGKRYLCNHTSGRVIVRILREITRSGYGSGRDSTHYIALNEKTGREIELKSAGKLIMEINT